jgi:hypothetical protein
MRPCSRARFVLLLLLLLLRAGRALSRGAVVPRPPQPAEPALVLAVRARAVGGAARPRGQLRAAATARAQQLGPGVAARGGHAAKHRPHHAAVAGVDGQRRQLRPQPHPRHAPRHRLLQQQAAAGAAKGGAAPAVGALAAGLRRGALPLHEGRPPSWPEACRRGSARARLRSRVCVCLLQRLWQRQRLRWRPLAGTSLALPVGGAAIALPLPLLHHLHRHVAAHRRQAARQAAHAGLARPALDHGAHGGRGERQLAGAQPVLRQQARDEVPLRDVHLRTRRGEPGISGLLGDSITHNRAAAASWRTPTHALQGMPP